jgi:hypothetical protein
VVRDFGVVRYLLSAGELVRGAPQGCSAQSEGRPVKRT